MRRPTYSAIQITYFHCGNLLSIMVSLKLPFVKAQTVKELKRSDGSWYLTRDNILRFFPSFHFCGISTKPCRPYREMARLVTFAKWKIDTVLRPTPQMATAIMRTPSTRKVEESRLWSTILPTKTPRFLFQLFYTHFVKVAKALKVLRSWDFDLGPYNVQLPLFNWESMLGHTALHCLGS